MTSHAATFTRGDTVTYKPYPGAHPQQARVMGVAFGVHRYDLELATGNHRFNVDGHLMEREK